MLTALALAMLAMRVMSMMWHCSSIFVPVLCLLKGLLFCIFECVCVSARVCLVLCVWWSGGEREREKMREWENETTKREWHGGNGPVLSFVTFDVVKPHKLHKMLSNHVNHNVLVSHYVCWGRSFLHGVCVWMWVCTQCVSNMVEPTGPHYSSHSIWVCKSYTKQ